MPLRDDERVNGFEPLMHELAGMLDSEHPDLTPPEAMKAAESRGRMRVEQNYSIELLVTSTRMILRAIHDVVQENLLDLDLSRIISDMSLLEDSIGPKLLKKTVASNGLGGIWVEVRPGTLPQSRRDFGQHHATTAALLYISVVNSGVSPVPKLSLDIAREIRTAWKQGENSEQLGKRYHVSVSTIAAIVKGVIWKEPSFDGIRARPDPNSPKAQKVA